jgi:hypothetical protein
MNVTEMNNRINTISSENITFTGIKTFASTPIITG